METAQFLTKRPTQIIDGINIYESNNYNEWFEAEYAKTAEPWDYSKRGAELYRHIHIVEQIRRYNTTSDTLLELGCGNGLMTELLIPFYKVICAADISYTALRACKERCNAKAQKNGCRMEYFITTTPGLPFADESFSTVTLCDGLAAWWLSDEQKQLALEDVYRVLKKGGIAILTDYLMPVKNLDKFEVYQTSIRKSSFSAVKVGFIYDKPWYKIESLITKAGLKSILKRVLASIQFAKSLHNISRVIGRKASCHIVVILQKN